MSSCAISVLFRLLSFYIDVLINKVLFVYKISTNNISLIIYKHSRLNMASQQNYFFSRMNRPKLAKVASLPPAELHSSRCWPLTHIAGNYFCNVTRVGKNVNKIVISCWCRMHIDRPDLSFTYEKMSSNSLVANIWKGEHVTCECHSQCVQSANGQNVTH